MSTSRVLVSHPRSEARLRLICFPSAGSGASMFRQWGARLPNDVEVVGIHLPGREALIAEPLLDSIAELALAVRPAVEPYLNRPYAFFGHSMGAWIAFELARAFAFEGRALPVHFFASARRAPQIRDPRTAIHQLDDNDLVRTVVKLFGGIPAAVLAEPELMQLLLPILRADLTAVETYSYDPGPPLHAAISAFGGQSDEQISLSDLQGWGEQTREPFDVRLFPGGHFYLNEMSGEALCQVIGKCLKTALAMPDEKLEIGAKSSRF